MNKIEVKFTREKLYEGVWCKTMVSLAKEILICDNESGVVQRLAR